MQHLPFNHNYSVVGWSSVQVYDAWTRRHMRDDTYFKLLCTGCGKLKDKRIAKEKLRPEVATEVARIKYGYTGKFVMGKIVV